MATITDFSTATAKVRLLIADIDLANPIFGDAAIDAFLSVQNNSLKKAAALALTVMAANEVMVQKRIKLLDLETDGPAEADALMAIAAQYRAEAAAEASGQVAWLDPPSGLAEFDRRSVVDWRSLQGDRS